MTKPPINYLGVIPVLPSADIERDLKWYKDMVGFEPNFNQNGYGGMSLGNVFVHLQWHAGTKEDPLIGGSVIKIFTDNARAIFKDLVERGTIEPNRFRENTAWGTNEFGFHDLNNNAVFFVEVISK